MGGRARADGLRVELENDAGMVANALVDRSERRLVRDRKREVVQADIGLAVEGYRVPGSVTRQIVRVTVPSETNTAG